jgi:hypothetical protein
MVTRIGRAFVKRSDDASAVFARIDLFADDTVSRLTRRAADELRWGVDAGHVELFLVRRGGEDTPLAHEQQKALELERLGEGWGLSRAGIADGAWLLAKITAAPASTLGKKLRGGGGGRGASAPHRVSLATASSVQVSVHDIPARALGAVFDASATVVAAGSLSVNHSSALPFSPCSWQQRHRCVRGD